MVADSWKDGQQSKERHASGCGEQGTRLPPWVSDGETFTRPGVKEVRSGEPGIGQLRHPRPCERVFLAAPPQRAPPQVGHMVAEGHRARRFVGTA